MTDRDKLLAELDAHSGRPECHDAAATIRAQAVQLKTERASREEAEQRFASTHEQLLVSRTGHAKTLRDFNVALDASREWHSQVQALAAYKDRAEAAEAKLATVEAETIERCAKAVRRLIHCTDDAGEQSLLENAVSDILDLKPAAAPEAGECSVEPNEISSPASAAAPTTADELHTVICQAVGLHNQGDTTAAAQILRHALMMYKESAQGQNTDADKGALPAAAPFRCELHGEKWCGCPAPTAEVVRPLICNGSRQIIEPSPTSNMRDKEFAAAQDVRLDQRQGAQPANGDSTAVRAEVLPALAAAPGMTEGIDEVLARDDALRLEGMEQAADFLRSEHCPVTESLIRAEIARRKS